MSKNSLFIMVLALTIMTACGSSPSSSSSPVSVDVFWDTAILQNVTRLTDDGLSKDWAKVSPDGTKMLYCESDRTIKMTDMSEPNQYWNIMLLRDINVPAKTPLTIDSAYAPSWYETNNNFVYAANEARNSRNTSIMRSIITGGGRTYITRNSVGHLDTRPAIRGGVILCDTEVNNRRRIVSMKDSGMEVTILGEGHSPSWHPTLDKFVFIRDGDVYEMHLGSIQVTQLHFDPDFNCAMPSYSPDGNYIMFQKGAVRKGRGSGGKKTDRWQIFVTKSDGTSLSPLTIEDVDSYSGSWDLHDCVYFISNASGKPEIYRAQIDFQHIR